MSRRAVRVIVDDDLRGAERLIFHPNINTASVTISVRGFRAIPCVDGGIP